MDGNIIQYYIEDGVIKTRSLIYIHFQKRNIEFSAFNNLCNSYIFTSKKIIPITGSEMTMQEIKKYNTSNLNHFLKRFWYRVKIKTHFKESIFDAYLMKIKG